MHHLLLVVHTHAIVVIQLLVVVDVSLQVLDAVSAAHDAVLFKMRGRLLVHSGLGIVDNIT